MKRVFTLILVCAILFSLAACGGDNSASTTGTTGTAAITSTATTTATSTAATTKSTTTVITTTTEAPKPVFEELTVLDDEECLVKITNVDPENIWGFTLNTYIENKSEDTAYTFSIISAAVDGVEIEPFFSTDVAAGKKSHEEINLFDSTVEELDVLTYSDIELTLKVRIKDDWTADPISETTFHVYPNGDENAETYERLPQPEDIILVDNDQVSVIATGYEIDDIWVYTVKLWLINKNDTTIMVSVENASVNGFMIDPFFARSVIPGKCRYAEICWYEDTLTENKIDINKIEELEFILKVRDYDDWLSSSLFEDTVTLNPKTAE